MGILRWESVERLTACWRRRKTGWKSRFGGLDTGTQPAPHQVVETEKMFRLRRYFPDTEGTGPDVILVHPMMVSANIYDVTEDKGAVTIPHNHGITPWVVDFGSPDREEGGMERTLADHIVALSRVIDIVIETTGRDVHLAGYSQGGMWVYQTAALRRSKGIASVITYGSPVDVLAALPSGCPRVSPRPARSSSPTRSSRTSTSPAGWRGPASRCSTRSRPHVAALTS